MKTTPYQNEKKKKKSTSTMTQLKSWYIHYINDKSISVYWYIKNKVYKLIDIPNISYITIIHK